MKPLAYRRDNTTIVVWENGRHMELPAVFDVGDPISEDYIEPFMIAIGAALVVKQKRCEADTPKGTKVWYEPVLKANTVQLDASQCDWIPTLVTGIKELSDCWLDWTAWLKTYDWHEVTGEAFYGYLRLATYNIDINQRG